MIAEAGPEAVDDLARLATAWRRTMLGQDEPACSLDEVAAWFVPRADRRTVVLLATESGRAVGTAWMSMRTDRSQPLAGFAPVLYVDPAARRRGIGAGLVAALTDAAREAGAPLLVLRQDDADEGGARFADALGATRGFRGLQNRCRIDHIDPGLLRAWVERASERARGWTLIGWDQRCPDDLLDAFAEVQSAMHDAPVPVMAVTGRSAAEIRDAEALAAAMGGEHWVLAARNDATGVLGGYTEMAFEPTQPWLGHQGDTGVVPAQRELGLGRWLKAALTLRLLAERPEVTQLETNTAEDNPAMRGINEAMGYRPAVVWQDRELPVR